MWKRLDGKKYSGCGTERRQFRLQMMDMGQQIHVFEKDKLKSCEISRESRMPAYDAKTLSDKELEDIVAYLVSVSTGATASSK